MLFSCLLLLNLFNGDYFQKKKKLPLKTPKQTAIYFFSFFSVLYTWLSV